MRNRGKRIDGYDGGGLVPYPAEYARRLQAHGTARGVQAVLAIVVWVMWAGLVAAIALGAGQVQP